jgi:hypothetical protein
VLGDVSVTVRERPDGRSLELLAPPDNIYELIPQGGDAFTDMRWGGSAHFERDSGGKVTGVEFYGNRLTRRP